MRDAGRAVGWTVVGIVCLVLVIGAGIGMQAAGLAWYAPWRENKRTEVIRNTNQYVTTQQAQMRDAWQRYLDPDATEGQKRAAMQDWCAAASRVDDEFVMPPDAKPVARQEGCWNGY